MSLLRQTSQRFILLSVARQPLAPLSYRGYAGKPERHSYDPDQDQTPRRRYIFGAALAITAGIALMTSINRSVKSDAPDEAGFVKDPATDVAFPKTLSLPGTPDLTLLGLGVRTVSFLGIKVYSVGFYADLNQRGLQAPTNATPDERIEHLVRNTTCALRIVPTRSTSLSHLRDGFVRAIQKQITQASQKGYLSPEQEDALIQPVQHLKGLFPNVSLPKHKPLHAVLTAPELGSGTRTLFFPELGRVEDSWLASEFFLAYFSGKGISPAMKKSVEDAVANVGGWGAK